MKQTLKEAKRALESGRGLRWVVRAGVLVAFAVLAAGCGAPIISETTADSVEQPVETTSTTNIPESTTERANPVGESPGSTVADTTTKASLGVPPTSNGGQGSSSSTVVDTTTLLHKSLSTVRHGLNGRKYSLISLILLLKV